jgi:NADH dehydrogenase
LVVFATRRAPSAEDLWLPYDLNSTDLALPPDTFAVVHLAADTRGSMIDAGQELAAARLLSDRARECGARMLFVSSQTAHPDAPTSYGRTKWMIEQIVLERSGSVIRPGQVYGADEAALFGNIVALVRALPILPAFIPSPLIQPVHVDDLAQAIVRMIECGNELKPVLEIGAAESVTFTEFLAAIAQYRLRRCRAFIPVPTFAIRVLATLLGEQRAAATAVGRLASLFALRPMQTADDLRSLGMQLRPLRSGMTVSGDGRRRVLIHEGRALLRYVLKREPHSALVRRYVSAARVLGLDEGCELPRIALSFPGTIALFERLDYKTQSRKILTSVSIAMALAEASTEGAPRFIAETSGRAFVGAVADVALAICREVATRLAVVAMMSMKVGQRRHTVRNG